MKSVKICAYRRFFFFFGNTAIQAAEGIKIYLYVLQQCVEETCRPVTRAARWHFGDIGGWLWHHLLERAHSTPKKWNKKTKTNNNQIFFKKCLTTGAISSHSVLKIKQCTKLGKINKNEQVFSAVISWGSHRCLSKEVEKSSGFCIR